MRIERVDETTVKLFITYSDIEARGFSREDLWTNRKRGEEFFWSMMDEIKQILKMTEDGTDEIISTRSKTYQKLNVDIDSLPLQDLYSIIQDNPGLLRRPIILDDKRLQVGYNEDEIRRFLPRKVRTFQLKEAQRLVD